MTSSDSDPSHDAELTYAWNWFQYHAGQRLAAFNFFLVIAGVTAVAFTRAIEKGWRTVGVAVGCLEALISVAFLCLDVRNEQLVDCGREALEKLERDRIVRPSTEATNRRTKWFSHSRWLRSIEVAVAFLFLVGAIWAGCGYP